jgi:hypothetical protein
MAAINKKMVPKIFSKLPVPKLHDALATSAKVTVDVTY